MFGGRCPSEQEIEETILEHSVILFSTVATGGRSCVQKSGPFDTVIVDEASQLAKIETLVVLRSPMLQQVVLVGDHKQLPPTVISQVPPYCASARCF